MNHLDIQSRVALARCSNYQHSHVRKAWWHFKAGDRDHRFGRMLLQVGRVLRPTLHVVDAVVAMEPIRFSLPRIARSAVKHALRRVAGAVSARWEGLKTGS